MEDIGGWVWRNAQKDGKVWWVGNELRKYGRVWRVRIRRSSAKWNELKEMDNNDCVGRTVHVLTLGGKRSVVDGRSTK